MDPFIGVMFVLMFLKMVAEDGYSAASGRPNPRLARRAARQRSRSNNRVWGAMTNYLGDVAEDAREQAIEKRRRKQAEKARQRELAEREAEELEAERAELRPHRFVSKGGPLCAYSYGTDFSFGCGFPERAPIHIQSASGDAPAEPKEPSTATRPEAAYPTSGPRSNVIPFPTAPTATNTQENTMTATVNGEVTGLDPAIAYADSLATFAEEHAAAGNEGYIAFLQQSKVEGETLATAHAMQEAFGNAAAAADAHKTYLEEQKTVQEAYNQNPDAGDKAFQQNGQ